MILDRSRNNEQQDLRLSIILTKKSLEKGSNMILDHVPFVRFVLLVGLCTKRRPWFNSFKTANHVAPYVNTNI